MLFVGGGVGGGGVGVGVGGIIIFTLMLKDCTLQNLF
jgi:hypothetical protein